MSAHVNLLPPELAQRSRVARARALTLAAVAGWVGVLAVLYIIKLGTVAGVERQRDEAAQEVADLQQQVTTLQTYAELDRQLSARNDLLAAAMASEVSWARLLNDLALAFPSNSSLLTLTATTAPQEAAQQAQVEAVEQEIGTFEVTGYSIQEFAPGVEAVLLRLGDVRGLFNTYLAQATDELRGGTPVTTFSGSAELNEEIFTRRYVEGLPAEEDG